VTWIAFGVIMVLIFVVGLGIYLFTRSELPRSKLRGI
jgi:hypothetical protein